MNTATKGVLATLIGSSCWGFSGACSQYLFSHYAIDTAWLAALRMFTAGVLLTGCSIFKYRHSLKQLLTVPQNLLQLVAFAFLGLSSCQYTYLAAIAHSNAGTATVLQYLMPVFVLLYMCCSLRQKPTKRELAAIMLALAGTFLLATHGNINTMVLTPAGLIWGLLAAVTAAVYSLLPRKLMAAYGSVPVVGCGMLAGGTALSFPAGLWHYTPPLDMAGLAALAAIVLIGTVIAFTLYLQGVKDIGPVKASLLASAEPLAAAVLAVMWLDTELLPLDFLGFACIIATVFILTLKKA